MAKQQPSNWQQAIDGQWHGCPSVFEHDGTHVGTNQVSRASEFEDGRTTYWMETRFDASGPLMDRFEMGTRMEFGVVDSDQDRIYTGPDFVGSGRPFGLLVDSNYYSPGWNVNLRTVNHVVPDLGLQVYSSQLFEADTLVGLFNGLYVVTHDYDTNLETQRMVSEFLAKEKRDGRRPFNLPVKHEGVFAGEFEVYDDAQNFVGTARVRLEHTPVNLLHSRQTIRMEGFLNHQWSALRTRNGNSHQYHGPDLYGNGRSYGRYLYSVRHVYGEPYRLWSREVVIDEQYTLVCVWQFLNSHKEEFTAFGVLRFASGQNLLSARFLE